MQALKIADLPCEDPEIQSGGEWSSHQRISQRTMYITREAIGHIGSNCFSRGVHTSISKETSSNF